MKEQEKNHEPATGAESGIVAIGEKVVMQTAPVLLGCNDKFYETTALFETGSTRTYITEEFAKMLKARPVEQQTF